MKQDEYNFNPETESLRVPDELAAPADFLAQPTEMLAPAPEYGAHSGRGDEIDSHGRKKRLLFMPAAAVVASLSILFASLNSDPLGSNFLASSAAASPAATAAPVSPGSTASSTPVPGYADAFPTLPNPDPDFSGAYAWGGMGSEEYLILDNHYMHAGTYYTDGGVTIESSLSGAVYDKATNTLTLNNYHGGFIDANLMGNGFKIELIGDNSLDSIVMWGAMYGGSVTFTGTGGIKLNESGKSPNGTGIYLECEYSPSCIMIDRNVTVEVFGSPAIVVHRTTLEQSVYTLSPISVTGGTFTTGEFVIYTVNVTDDNGYIVYDDDGNPLTKQITVRDLAEERGMSLYDYSALDADGKPSTHVLFAPEE